MLSFVRKKFRLPPTPDFALYTLNSSRTLYLKVDDSAYETMRPTFTDVFISDTPIPPPSTPPPTGQDFQPSVNVPRDPRPREPIDLDSYLTTDSEDEAAVLEELSRGASQ